MHKDHLVSNKAFTSSSIRTWYGKTLSVIEWVTQRYIFLYSPAHGILVVQHVGYNSNGCISGSKTSKAGPSCLKTFCSKKESIIMKAEN